ncbi:MAG: hypothetical protein NPINA01_17360 [Nitrospinaceae bacterium]|nr:MAG: hypothetical protein NPINA01_17360 [Nitrospinaceae bacterium]
MIQKEEYPPATRGKIIVWGFIASYPFGGMTWQVLHHLAGFRRLGFDVWYVEDSNNAIYDPATWEPAWSVLPNVQYLKRQMESIGLGDRWVFRPPRAVSDSQKSNKVCLGALDLSGLSDLYKEADVVFNLCGSHELRPDHEGIQCLVYLQTDPVVHQIEIAEGNQKLIDEYDAYDFLFSYGENLGSPDCLVPVERYVWHPTRPPVVMEWWATNGSPQRESKLTTVSNWQNLKKDIVWKGETYRWRKDIEFKRFIALPERSPLSIELALEGIKDQDAAMMRDKGWKIVSARELGDPLTYRAYIRRSAGEFTVAKDQNIRLRSGWFSDRSVCYLAAGRPVISQDTAFGKFIPTGEGLFSFTTLDEIVNAADAIDSDYGKQSRAAREIANEYFRAETVLKNVLDVVGF